MPRFLVTELRACKCAYLIDSESEDAARQLDGKLIDSAEGESYASELLGILRVDDDEEEAILSLNEN